MDNIEVIIFDLHEPLYMRVWKHNRFEMMETMLGFKYEVYVCMNALDYPNQNIDPPSMWVQALRKNCLN